MPVVADRDRIVQVLTNLLGNALTYTLIRWPGCRADPGARRYRLDDGLRQWRGHLRRRPAASSSRGSSGFPGSSVRPVGAGSGSPSRPESLGRTAARSEPTRAVWAAEPRSRSSFPPAPARPDGLHPSFTLSHAGASPRRGLLKSYTRSTSGPVRTETQWQRQSHTSSTQRTRIVMRTLWAPRRTSSSSPTTLTTSPTSRSNAYSSSRLAGVASFPTARSAG